MSLPIFAFLQFPPYNLNWLIFYFQLNHKKINIFISTTKYQVMQHETKDDNIK
jgi:hypothetical protein